MDSQKEHTTPKYPVTIQLLIIINCFTTFLLLPKPLQLMTGQFWFMLLLVILKPPFLKILTKWNWSYHCFQVALILLYFGIKVLTEKPMLLEEVQRGEEQDKQLFNLILIQKIFLLYFNKLTNKIQEILQHLLTLLTGQKQLLQPTNTPLFYGIMVVGISKVLMLIMKGMQLKLMPIASTLMN